MGPNWRWRSGRGKLCQIGVTTSNGTSAACAVNVRARSVIVRLASSTLPCSSKIAAHAWQEQSGRNPAPQA